MRRFMNNREIAFRVVVYTIAYGTAITIAVLGLAFGWWSELYSP